MNTNIIRNAAVIWVVTQRFYACNGCVVNFFVLLYPGEYITLYQTQRNALKSYYKDRERMIAQMSSEKANMQVSVTVKVAHAHAHLCNISPLIFFLHFLFDF